MHFRSHVCGQSRASRFVTYSVTPIRLKIYYKGRKPTGFMQSHLDGPLANSRMCNQHKNVGCTHLRRTISFEASDYLF